jgi:hypothetical protein
MTIYFYNMPMYYLLLRFERKFSYSTTPIHLLHLYTPLSLHLALIMCDVTVRPDMWLAVMNFLNVAKTLETWQFQRQMSDMWHVLKTCRRHLQLRLLLGGFVTSKKPCKDELLSGGRFIAIFAALSNRKYFGSCNGAGGFGKSSIERTTRLWKWAFAAAAILCLLWGSVNSRVFRFM